MITKEKLENYAKKLMFEMNEEEYQTLEDEFEIILKQMDYIEQMEGIKDVEPMTFPFPNTYAKFREDTPTTGLSEDDVLRNAKDQENSQVKIPKVVE